MQDSRKNANDTLTVELLVRGIAVTKIQPTLRTSSVTYPLLQNDEPTAATEYPYAIWNEDIQSIPDGTTGGHTMKSEDENEMITTENQSSDSTDLLTENTSMIDYEDVPSDDFQNRTDETSSSIEREYNATEYKTSTCRFV